MYISGKLKTPCSVGINFTCYTKVKEFTTFKTATKRLQFKGPAFNKLLSSNLTDRISLFYTHPSCPPFPLLIPPTLRTLPSLYSSLLPSLRTLPSLLFFPLSSVNWLSYISTVSNFGIFEAKDLGFSSVVIFFLKLVRRLHISSLQFPMINKNVSI